ncbi:MAG: BamA/TamA family outer membrane protein [Cyclobacteriaceae bacterium]
MKNKTIYHFFIQWQLILLGGILVAGCNVKRFIPEDEFLYVGGEVKIEKDEPIQGVKAVKGEMEVLLRPEPNRKILGMRIGLWAYYKGTKENPGFINRFLKNKIGEEPVYLSEASPPRTEEILHNRLENKGYFYSEVSSEVTRKDKFASVDYEILLKAPYTLKNYQYDHDGLAIDKEIRELLELTEIKEGDRFDLDLLKKERERLDVALKEKGFYNFSPNLLVFEADTNQYEEKHFDLFLRLKENTPEKGIAPYEIRDIKVYPNYSIDQYGEDTDTTEVRGIQFIQETKTFKPELMEQYILMDKGEKFDSKKSRLTSNRLSGIGNYQYVNIRYEEDSLIRDGLGALDMKIYLSPMDKRSLRAELQGVSKSNNFAGPALLLSYKNRNLYLGGELFNLTAKFAYETQIASGKRDGLNSLELGLRGDLIYPRVVFPIQIRERFAYSVPKTKISLGTEFQDRSKLYRLNTISASYGYFWNANRFVFHEINPINLNFVNLSRTTADFEVILDDNPFLRQSFDEQFIAGITYSFAFNKLMDTYRTHSIFFGANLDIAGFGLNGLNELVNSENTNTFLGFNYAQYNKADIDFRYYWRFSEDNLIATRLFMGVGLPYGNSNSLPFVKQFFSGGPNSIRAFRIRSLGPGTYRSDLDGIGGFFDQAGDIRLEGNLEYRFPIVSYLKGAVFADAGNVWLVKENEALPGGKFSSDWFGQLGVGTGIGLRVDVEFFVIRFDLATPIRKPYLPEGARWENSFDVKDSQWRRENLVFNFAIGYPF